MIAALLLQVTVAVPVSCFVVVSVGAFAVMVHDVVPDPTDAAANAVPLLMKSTAHASAGNLPVQPTR